MVFGKLTGGEIAFAKRAVEYNGELVKHPTDDILRALGFLEVQFTEQPEAPEGYEYAPTWAEDGGVIVQGWELSPLDDEITDEEALNILLGGEE